MKVVKKSSAGYPQKSPFLWFFLAWCLISSCRTSGPTRPSESRSPSVPQQNLQNAPQPVLVRQLKLSSLDLASPALRRATLVLGPLKIPTIEVQPAQASEFFVYTLCAQNHTCQSGKMGWGAQLFPGLRSGSSTITVTSCFNNDAAAQPPRCSSPARIELPGQSGKDPYLESSLTQLVSLATEIRKESKAIWQELTSFYRGQSDSAAQGFSSQQLSTIATMGEDAYAELLNSSLYAELRAKTIKVGQQRKGDNSLALTGSSSLPLQPGDSAPSLEERINQLEKQEKIQDTVIFSHLIAFGTISTFLGCFLLYKNWLPEFEAISPSRATAAIDEFFRMLRIGAYGPLGGREDMNDDLFNRTYLDKKSINLDNTHTLYTTASGEIWLRESNLGGVPAYYKKDAGLKAVPLPAVNANMTITLDQFEALKRSGSLAESDFELIPDGDTYGLRAGAENRYIIVAGQLYRKTFPEYGSVYPKLSRESLNNLFNHWTSLKRQGLADVDSNYGRGIPLISEDGRLVEPPESWKVPGLNWFEESNEGNLFAPIYIKQPLDLDQFPRLYQAKINVPEAPYLEWPSTSKTKRYVPGDLNHVMIPDAYKSGIGQIKRAWTTGDPYIHEINIRWGELNAKRIAESSLAQFSTTVEGANKRIKAARKYQRGIGIGPLIAGGGSFAASVFFVPEFELTSSKLQSLLVATSKRDARIATLHRQRLLLVKDIEGYLRRGGYPVPDFEWAYHL